MESIDLGNLCKETEIRRDKLFEGKIKHLTVYNAWNSHGKIVEDFQPSKEFKNVDVKLERIRFKREWKYSTPGEKEDIFDEDVLYINGERYKNGSIDTMDIHSLKGNLDKAVAIAIIGEG